MRLALISDIHGNYSALQAVLDDLSLQHADSIVCLGDIATNGPQPKQVIAEMQKIGCPSIVGNHDQALLDPNAAPGDGAAARLPLHRVGRTHLAPNCVSARWRAKRTRNLRRHSSHQCRDTAPSADTDTAGALSSSWDRLWLSLIL